MRKILLIVFAVSILFAGCGGERAQFKTAMLQMERGSFDNAAKTLSDILRSDPENLAALSARALAFEKLSRRQTKRADMMRFLKLAESDYQKAVKLSPNNYVILNNLGAFYISVKSYRQALTYLDRSVWSNKQYVLAYINRGIARYNLNLSASALDDFHVALFLDPNNPMALFNRGLIYYDMRLYALAIDDFTDLIYTNPKNPRAYIERGRALQAAGDYVQALSDYETAAYLDPSYSLAYYHIGDLEFKRGEREKALASLEKSKQLNNTYIPTYELMGDILAVEDPINAAANYIIARELDPSNARKYQVKIEKMLTSEGRKEVVEARLDSLI
ncbi:Tfp pilus assembly protein PilF [Parelusimicrobium proximum]|uniref:tetratricopeptide repeat protein n=1 Tax=Parelusimicrobium proximum TaxID=3228953 RepID=UPI003D167529